MWLVFGALTPITYLLARRFPLRRQKIGRSLVIHFLGALLVSLGWSSLGVLLSVLLGRNPQQETLARYSIFWLLTNLPWAVALYFAVLGCVHAVTYYREARERESQQARLAIQLSEAKLGALRMQLNPHFLFNSLNAITVLVRDRKTQDASRMLELLSGVLRQVLKNERRQEVTLHEELRFIERYLAIEEVRFSDRLKIRWSIEPGITAAVVPEFILQPLVENAIKHGIAKSNQAGVIEIRAELAGSDLLLVVQDNGPGYQPGNQSGVGLTNIRSRLETSFGSRGKLDISNSENGGTIASLRFPFRVASAQ
jgi:LytS/YehU family sensor histidine kinase